MSHSVVFLLLISFTLSIESKPLKFFHLSDIHFDPFYNASADEKTRCHYWEGSGTRADYEAPYGRIGCNSPEMLWKIALSGMKEKGCDAEFMMISGDSTAHGLTDDQGSPNVLKCLSFVSSEAHKVFPDIPIFPAFGNNDLPGHYIFPNNSDWYRTVLSYWAPHILCSNCPKHVQRPTTMEALEKTFIDGGYYSVNIADGKMILLVLNTMYWNNNRYSDPLVEQIAENQMRWFTNQLQLAKDQRKRVLIMSHIPPGGDPFGYSYFWYPEYVIPYVSLTAGQFHDIVAGQFYAHTHINDFRVQIMNAASEEAEKTSTKSFVLQTASLSPVYANNPTFRVISLDRKKRALVDYDQYYLDLVLVTEFSNPVWKFDFTFSKKYPSKNKFIDADRIHELNRRLISQTDGTYWNAYMPSTTSNYQRGPYDRFALYCITRYVLEEDFKKCLEKFKVPGG